MRVARLLLQDGRRVYAELAHGRARLWSGAPWLGGEPSGEHIDGVDEDGRGTCVELLVPCEPSKIVCVGRNYVEHAAEFGNEVPNEPLLFMKPPSALLAARQAVILPPTSLSQRVEHEVELGIVIGRRTHRADRASAAAAIAGYTIVGDITARDIQRADRLWTRGKGFDTFCPTGPLVCCGEAGEQHRSVRCWVNDELRQDGNTEQMTFTPADIIAYISQVMTLQPGDLIATGTPAGVGPLKSGDRVRMAIAGIGTLHFDVRADAGAVQQAVHQSEPQNGEGRATT